MAILTGISLGTLLFGLGDLFAHWQEPLERGLFWVTMGLFGLLACVLLHWLLKAMAMKVTVDLKGHPDVTIPKGIRLKTDYVEYETIKEWRVSRFRFLANRYLSVPYPKKARLPVRQVGRRI